MSEVSKLSIYSIGIVAANKPLGTRVAEITPIEDNPMSDGELTDAISKYKSSSTDSSGSAYQVEATTTNTVKATWLPMGTSNRVTAPDIRRGETVILYRFANTDEFFWATLKDDLHLRKLETVIYAFSGTTDEAADSTATNTYFLEISTHNKYVHFHTSKTNGEPFIYDIQINTKDGFIKIQDDDGQFISLDSKERQLIIENRDGSKVDVNKKEIFIDAPDLISLKAKAITQESTTNSMKATTVTQSATSSTMNGSGSITIAGGAVSISGSTVAIT